MIKAIKRFFVCLGVGATLMASAFCALPSEKPSDEKQTLAHMTREESPFFFEQRSQVDPITGTVKVQLSQPANDTRVMFKKMTFTNPNAASAVNFSINIPDLEIARVVGSTIVEINPVNVNTLSRVERSFPDGKRELEFSTDDKNLFLTFKELTYSANPDMPKPTLESLVSYSYDINKLPAKTTVAKAIQPVEIPKSTDKVVDVATSKQPPKKQPLDTEMKPPSQVQNPPEKKTEGDKSVKARKNAPELLLKKDKNPAPPAVAVPTPVKVGNTTTTRLSTLRPEDLEAMKNAVPALKQLLKGDVSIGLLNVDPERGDGWEKIGLRHETATGVPFALQMQLAPLLSKKPSPLMGEPVTLLQIVKPAVMKAEKELSEFDLTPFVNEKEKIALTVQLAERNTELAETKATLSLLKTEFEKYKQDTEKEKKTLAGNLSLPPQHDLSETQEKLNTANVALTALKIDFDAYRKKQWTGVFAAIAFAAIMLFLWILARFDISSFKKVIVAKDTTISCAKLVAESAGFQTIKKEEQLQLQLGALADTLRKQREPEVTPTLRSLLQEKPQEAVASDEAMEDLQDPLASDEAMNTIMDLQTENMDLAARADALAVEMKNMQGSLTAAEEEIKQLKISKEYFISQKETLLRKFLNPPSEAFYIGEHSVWDQQEPKKKIGIVEGFATLPENAEPPNPTLDTELRGAVYYVYCIRHSNGIHCEEIFKKRKMTGILSHFRIDEEKASVHSLAIASSYGQ